jgi:hypothetical protein
MITNAMENLSDIIPTSVKLGTFQTMSELYSEIRRSGMILGDYTVSMMQMNAFTIADKESSPQLVITSGAKLGLRGPSINYADLCERATSQEFGYLLCPPEVGPQLRLQYKVQPKFESLMIGMKPIPGMYDGHLRVFSLCRGIANDDLWLTAPWVGSGSHIAYNQRWVFLQK